MFPNLNAHIGVVQAHTDAIVVVCELKTVENLRKQFLNAQLPGLEVLEKVVKSVEASKIFYSWIPRRPWPFHCACEPESQKLKMIS